MERTSHTEENGPPCRRCSQKRWHVEVWPKSNFRFWLEVLLAAPEVFTFGDESAGWPDREGQLWVCLNCNRRVRR